MKKLLYLFAFAILLTSCSIEYQAKEYMKKMIKKSIDDPYSAKFEDIKVIYKTKYGYTNYVVLQCNVRSKNGYGAYQLWPFECIYEKNKKGEENLFATSPKFDTPIMDIVNVEYERNQKSDNDSVRNAKYEWVFVSNYIDRVYGKK